MEKDNRRSDLLSPKDSVNTGLNLKHLSGIWIGKLIMGASRLTGRGGTTLPGRAALRFSPGILAYLSRQLAQGSVLVTGTNGKTTTASLLTGILRQAGYQCLHNQSGSNMSWGVASALIGAGAWSGKLPGDIGIMEVDEGAFPAVVRELKPRGAVVTNIYRDQLDRFGEIDHVQKTILSGLDCLPPDSFQVLNADDPSLTDMRSDRPGRTWYYGLELELPPDLFRNTAQDIKSCPHCHDQLFYERIYFAHLGRYRCQKCNFRRPKPDVTLNKRFFTADGRTVIELRLQGKSLKLDYPLMGAYNLYNALAAATCATALGVPADLIGAALTKAAPSFGRMERFSMDGRTLIMALIKNPAGANEVLRTLIEKEGKIHLLVAINDKIADGTDISWLWDADFEQLKSIRERLAPVVVSGQRAWEMVLRLKYAGLDSAGITLEESPKQAILKALQLTPPGEILFIMPTYTAMFDLRRALNALGVAKPYWEGP
ncbi:MAG: DUF1727 domain-containing protein [Dethiobacter sp.]|nr:DUF1727 domain-containing protein [Dethiobacter sp.]